MGPRCGARVCHHGSIRMDLVMVSGTVDAPMMLFVASLLICCGLLLYVNRQDFAARNAKSIKSLASLYGKRITQRTAAASTPQMTVYISAFSVTMGLLALVILPFRLGVPIGPISIWMTTTLGVLQVLVACGIFAIRISQIRSSASVVRRTRNLRITAIVSGACGVATLASLLTIFLGKAG